MSAELKPEFKVNVPAIVRAFTNVQSALQCGAPCSKGGHAVFAAKSEAELDPPLPDCVGSVVGYVLNGAGGGFGVGFLLLGGLFLALGVVQIRRLLKDRKGGEQKEEGKEAEEVDGFRAL